ncbi:hypothetical protein FRC02_005315 [Tulasnella sp. 418]|nr:hypothetical protein FRC02_005315 [Tulasnella sp. 418]
MNKNDIKREENEDSPIPLPRQQPTQMDMQYKYEEYCDPFLKLDNEDNVKNSQSSATPAALVSFPPPDTILLTQSSYYSQLDSDILQAILKLYMLFLNREV